MNYRLFALRRFFAQKKSAISGAWCTFLLYKGIYILHAVCYNGDRKEEAKMLERIGKWLDIIADVITILLGIITMLKMFHP